jgi:hypothetical protein
MHAFYYLASAVTFAAAQDPTIDAAPNFRIRAAPGYLDRPLSIVQGSNLSFQYISPCYQPAVFVPNATPTVFYVNGTDDEFASRQATLTTDRDGPPEGVMISTEADADGRRAVYLGCGEGSPGLQVADWPGTVYYETGTMYVCDSSALGYGPLGLFWHEHGAPTPKDCLGLTLEAWCVDKTGMVHEFERNSTCYR